MSLTTSIDSLKESQDFDSRELFDDDSEKVNDLQNAYNNLVEQCFMLTESNLKVSNKLKNIEIEKDNLLAKLYDSQSVCDALKRVVLVSCHHHDSLPPLDSE